VGSRGIAPRILNLGTGWRLVVSFVPRGKRTPSTSLIVQIFSTVDIGESQLKVAVAFTLEKVQSDCEKLGEWAHC